MLKSFIVDVRLGSKYASDIVIAYLRPSKDVVLTLFEHLVTALAILILPIDSRYIYSGFQKMLKFVDVVFLFTVILRIPVLASVIKDQQ